MQQPLQGREARRWGRPERVHVDREDPVEPGSIFKPFIMSAALAEGVTKPTESIYCHGGLYITGKRKLNDHHPYGNLTSAEIVAKYSNIGMAIIGLSACYAAKCGRKPRPGLQAC